MMGMIFLLKESAALFILCQFALFKCVIKNRIISSFLRLPSGQLTFSSVVVLCFFFFLKLFFGCSGGCGA